MTLRRLRQRAIFGPILCVAIALLSPGTVTGGQVPLEQQQKELDIIADFADRICKDVPLQGKEDKLELSGKAKAELRGMVKQFADIGVAGAANYKTSKYEGVLQSDLVKALQDSANCKLKVFEGLRDKLLSPRVNVIPAQRLAKSGTIVRIEHKGSYKNVEVSRLPPGLRLLIADIYLDIGSQGQVQPNDYFKILRATTISQKSKFTDYVGIIKVNEVNAGSSLGKILYLKSGHEQHVHVGVTVEKIFDSGNKMYSELYEKERVFTAVKYHIGKDFKGLMNKLSNLLTMDARADSESIIKAYRGYAPYQFIDVISESRYKDYVADLDRFIVDNNNSFWLPNILREAVNAKYELQRYQDVTAAVRLLKERYREGLSDGEIHYLERRASLSALRNAISSQPLNADAHIALAKTLTVVGNAPLFDIPEAIIEYHFIFLLNRDNIFLSKAAELEKEYYQFIDQLKQATR